MLPNCLQICPHFERLLPDFSRLVPYLFQDRFQTCPKLCSASFETCSRYVLEVVWTCYGFVLHLFQTFPICSHLFQTTCGVLDVFWNLSDFVQTFARLSHTVAGRFPISAGLFPEFPRTSQTVFTTCSRLFQVCIYFR